MSSKEWNELTFGDICNSVSETHKSKTGKLIFLNTGDIDKGNILHRNYSEVEKMPGQAKKAIKRGDILFSEIRPANGRWAYIDFDSQDFIVSTKLMVIRAKKGINPRFIYNYLTSEDITSKLQQLAESRSGTFPQITFSQVADIKIKLPTEDTQNRITYFLDAINSKIELCHQTNHTLIEISKTLFQKYCTQDSDNISKGWSLKKLKEFIEVKNGYAFKGTDFIDDGVPVIKIKNVKAGKVILNQLSYVSREVADKALRFRIKQNDLLITMSGNRIDGTPETWVGKVGIFHREGEYLLNQRVSILNIIDEEKMSTYFLNQLLSNEDFQYHFISNATSSGGQANISPDLIYNTEILVPPIEQLKLFSEQAKDIYNKIFANELEVETLTTLRDIILPKLMKGEINI
jgi:type I restriction enzyme S subunit